MVLKRRLANIVIIALALLPSSAFAVHYCAKPTYHPLCGTYQTGFFGGKMGVLWAKKPCSKLGALEVHPVLPNVKVAPFMEFDEFCHAKEK